MGSGNFKGTLNPQNEEDIRESFSENAGIIPRVIEYVIDGAVASGNDCFYRYFHRWRMREIRKQSLKFHLLNCTTRN
jgi:hypothetical protein